MNRVIPLAAAALVASSAWAADPPQDLVKLRAAAEAGDRDAEYKLGMALDDGPHADHKAAFYWLHRAAEHGEITAWLFVGMAYGSENGVTLDRVEAYKWFDLFDRFAPKTAAYAEFRADAVEDRDAMAKRLTIFQIAEAKAREQAWLHEWDVRAAAANKR
jgi:TPR repeat protein